jgi:hypothetical protein
MMKIHYKIVEVWPDSHSIVVRYWTDLISEEFLASDDQRNEQGSPIRCRSDVSITLPVPTPEGAELEKIILSNAPRDWLNLLQLVNDPNVDTDLNSIQSLIGVTNTKTIEDVQQNTTSAPTDVLSDEEIQKMIEKLSSQSS